MKSLDLWEKKILKKKFILHFKKFSLFIEWFSYKYL